MVISYIKLYLIGYSKYDSRLFCINLKTQSGRENTKLKKAPFCYKHYEFLFRSLSLVCVL